MSVNAISFQAAANAYKMASNVAKTAANTVSSVQPSLQQHNAGFADLLKPTINSTVNALASAEKMTIKSVARQADINDVVTAVANAELTLQAVVTIRDRLVSAYQEVLSMPI